MATVPSWTRTGMNASDDIKRRVIAYYYLICDKDNSDKQDRSISIIQDENAKSIVLINDIRYKSRRSIDWSEIEIYLKQYIDECYEILESSDKVFIDTDFPDEFAHSKDTKDVKGANEKAKANAVTAIANIIEIATDLCPLEWCNFLCFSPKGVKNALCTFMCANVNIN